MKDKETLLVAFSTQKGGAGKTTLTVLTASYFHYVKGMNVAVIDCDYPQFSIVDLRAIVLPILILLQLLPNQSKTQVPMFPFKK